MQELGGNCGEGAPVFSMTVPDTSKSQKMLTILVGLLFPFTLPQLFRFCTTTVIMATRVSPFQKRPNTFILRVKTDQTHVLG